MPHRHDVASGWPSGGGRRPKDIPGDQGVRRHSQLGYIRPSNTSALSPRNRLTQQEQWKPSVQQLAGYAPLAHRRDQRGLPIDGFAAQIAAICDTHRGTLDTRNVKDFEHTGITVVDPWKSTFSQCPSDGVKPRQSLSVRWGQRHSAYNRRAQG